MVFSGSLMEPEKTIMIFRIRRARGEREQAQRSARSAQAASRSERESLRRHTDFLKQNFYVPTAS